MYTVPTNIKVNGSSYSIEELNNNQKQIKKALVSGGILSGEVPLIFENKALYENA